MFQASQIGKKRSALYIVGRLQEAQINSKSIQYSEQLLTEIKESK